MKVYQNVAFCGNRLTSIHFQIISNSKEFEKKNQAFENIMGKGKKCWLPAFFLLFP